MFNYRILLPVIVVIPFYIIYVINFRKKIKTHKKITLKEKINLITLTFAIIMGIIMQILVIINYGDFLNK